MHRDGSRNAKQRRDQTSAFAELFPDCPRKELFRSTQPWPELDGCLIILFASRSGSTFLARAIESRYRIGEIGETFNPPQLKAHATRAGLASPAQAYRYTVQKLGDDRWFGVKAGVMAIMLAERAGFVEAYLPKTRVITLFRRDLVAQAVSHVKAEMTGRFHSRQTETQPVDAEAYDRARILKKAKVMLRSMQALDRWLREYEVPKGKLFYEDFCNGDFNSVITLCDSLGLPQRTEPKTADRRVVEKIGDAVNDVWCRRFHDERDEEANEILEQFEALTRA